MPGRLDWEREEDGAQGRNRTADTVIFSHVLYQLSYLGTEALGGAPIEAGSASCLEPDRNFVEALRASTDCVNQR